MAHDPCVDGLHPRELLKGAVSSGRSMVLGDMQVVSYRLRIPVKLSGWQFEAPFPHSEYFLFIETISSSSAHAL